MRSILLKAVNAYPEEAGRVYALLAKGFFMGVLLATFDISASTLFLNLPEFKANQDTLLPIAILSSGALGLVITILYTYFQERLSYRKLTLVFLAGLAVVQSLLIIWLYGATDDVRSIAIFLLFISIVPFNYIVTLIFWGDFGRLFSLKQSKRIIGGIDTGQLIASIVALFSIPIILQFVVEADRLLLISLIALILLFLVQWRIVVAFRIGMDAPTRNPSARQAVNWIWLLKNKYVITMALFVIISMIAVNFIDYAFLSVTSQQYTSESELAAFLSLFEAAVIIFSFLFQTFITDKIIAIYGLKIGLIVNPLVTVLLIVVAAGFGGIVGFDASAESFVFFFLLISVVKFVTSSLKDALDGPTFKLYFLPIDSNIRFNVQSRIEGVVTALSSFLAGAIIIAINSFKIFNFVHVLLFLIPLGLGWVWLIFRMNSGYLSTLKNTLKNLPSETRPEQQDHTELHELLPDATIYDDPDQLNYALNLLQQLDPFGYEESLKLLANQQNPLTDAVIKSRINAINEIYPLRSSKESTLLSEEAKELALKARSSTVTGEVIQLKPARLQALRKSRNPLDRLVVARVLPEAYSSDLLFVLLELLRDGDIRVRLAAIRAAGLIKTRETIPVLIEQLQSSVFHEAAASAMVQMGGRAVHSLDQAFHKSGTTEKTMVRIIQILGRIGTPQALDRLWSKIEYPNQKIVREIVKILNKHQYRAHTGSQQLIEQFLDREIGKTLWNQVALEEIEQESSPGFEELKAALKAEEKQNFEHIFSLLSLLYERSSIALVKSNVETGTSDSIAYAMELLDMFISKELRAKLFPIIDDISVPERLKRLQLYFPRDYYDASETILYIMNRNYNEITSWTRVCAIRAYMETSLQAQPNELIAHVFNPSQLIREVAGFALKEKYPIVYREVMTRLSDEERLPLEQKIRKISGWQDKSFHLIIQKALLLNDVAILNELTPSEKSELALHMEVVRLGAGESLEISGYWIEKPFIWFNSGEIESETDGTEMKIVSVPGFIGEHRLLEGKYSITRITGRQPTVIYLFKREVLMQFLEQKPGFFTHFIRFLFGGNKRIKAEQVA